MARKEQYERIIRDPASSQGEKKNARRIMRLLFGEAPDIPEPLETEKKYNRSLVVFSATITIVAKVSTVTIRTMCNGIWLCAYWVRDKMEEYMRARGWRNTDYTEKYTNEDIFLMYMAIPRNIPRTYPGLRGYSPLSHLSWRQVKKIIDTGELYARDKKTLYRKVWGNGAGIPRE